MNLEEPKLRTYSDSPYKEVCEYLDSVGIDPYPIALADISGIGRYEYARDEDGRISRDLERTWIDWPNATIGATVIDMIKPWESKKK